MVFRLDHNRSCHVVVKGVASVLRENVCYSKHHKQCLNKIIHCSNFTKDCEIQRKNEAVITSVQSLNYMIRSGLSKEIFELRDAYQKEK